MNNLSTKEFEELVLGEGDSAPWSMDEWSWDPVSMVAVRRGLESDGSCDGTPGCCPSPDAASSRNLASQHFSAVHGFQDHVLQPHGSFFSNQTFSNQTLAGYHGDSVGEQQALQELAVPLATYGDEPAWRINKRQREDLLSISSDGTYGGGNWGRQVPSGVVQSMHLVQNSANKPLETDYDEGTAKRAAKSRSPTKARASFLCQVEGCQRELTQLTLYHVKAGICDEHMKAGSFLRNGAPHRFCQQCRRVHLLAAFDGSKHSCRAQLARRSARRRKGAGKVQELQVGVPPEQQKADIRLLPDDLLAAASTAANLGAARPSLQLPSSSLPSGLLQSQPARQQHLPLVQQQEGLQVRQNGTFSSGAVEGMGAGRLQLEQHTLPVSQQLQQLLAPAQRQPAFPGAPAPQQFTNLWDMGPLGPGAGSGSLGQAAAMLEQSAVDPHLDTMVVLMSIKLFQCTPEQLPRQLAQQLTGWLRLAPPGAVGYIRPGCVHLTLQATLARGPGGPPCVLGGVRAAIGQLLGGSGSEFWGERIMLVQLLHEVALVRRGLVAWVWDVTQQGAASPCGCGPSLPHIERCEPTCITPAVRQLRLSGRGLTDPHTSLLCLAGGRHHKLRVVSGGRACCVAGNCTDPACGDVAANRADAVTVELPVGIEPGLMHVEVQRGACVGSARPLLCVEDAELAAEVEGLVGSAAEAVAARLLSALGHVLVALRQPGCEQPQEFVVEAARELVAVACEEALPLLLAAVLPLATHGCGAADWLPACGRRQPHAMTPLHYAVKSGDPVMLEELGQWAEARGWPLACDVPGAGGLTPLHLAALQQEGGAEMALQMARELAPGPLGWFVTKAVDGCTPAELAQQAGQAALNAAMLQLVAADPGGPQVAAALRQALASDEKALAREREGGLHEQAVCLRMMGEPALRSLRVGKAV